MHNSLLSSNFTPTYNLGAMALSSITPTNLTVPKKKYENNMMIHFVYLVMSLNQQNLQIKYFGHSTSFSCSQVGMRVGVLLKI